MLNDKNKRLPLDRDCINIIANHEVLYWTERFGVTCEQLRNAVAQVGPMVNDVEKALKRSRR